MANRNEINYSYEYERLYVIEYLINKRDMTKFLNQR